MKISQFSRTKFTIVSLSLLAIVTLSGCAKSPQDLNVVTHSASNTMKTTATSSTSHEVVSMMHIPKAVLQEYQKKAAKEPNNYQAQINAAISYHVQGNDEQAIAYYNKAIQINPESGEAYNNIGNIYFRDKHEPQIAIYYYEKATKVQPDYGYGWLNLAMARKQVGDVSGAKSAIQNGLKKVSNQSGSVYQMLKTYEKRLQASS